MSIHSECNVFSMFLIRIDVRTANMVAMRTTSPHCERAVLFKMASWFLAATVMALLSTGCYQSDAEDVQALLDMRPLRGQKHDFGKHILDPDVPHIHEYAFTNTGSQSLKILGLFNAKPCCGVTDDVRPQTLVPGQTLKFRVRIKPSDGQVMHGAVLNTADPNAALEFYTSGYFYPKARIEEVDADETAEMPSQSSIQRNFHALFYQVTDQRQPDVPNKANIRSDQPAEWTSEATETTVAPGIIEWSRDLVVRSQRQTVPGVHESRLGLWLGKDLLTEHTYHWKNIPEVSASPEALFFKTGEAVPERKVLFRRADNRPFRIRRADIGLPGISAMRDDEADRAFHTIAVRVTDPAQLVTGAGRLEVIVDDNNGTRVVVPIYIRH